MLRLKIDAVGYRYSPAELSTLMALLGHEKIACMPMLCYPDQETFRKGIESLESKDVLSNVGGHILLDNVHALLIRNLCQCARFLAVSSNDLTVSLCVCKDMFLLTKSENSGLLLYAAPDLEEAETYFYDFLLLFPEQSEAAVFKDGQTVPLKIPLRGTPQERIQPELLKDLAMVQNKGT